MECGNIMMLENLRQLWTEYYPMVIGSLTALGLFIGTLYGIYTQVKPLIGKIQELKDKVTNIEKDDIANELDKVDFNTRILDLQTKIESPSVSPALTEQYQKQLDQLLAIKEKMESGLVKVEDLTEHF